ncbi:MAG: serine/threonine-protein kinase, partial [Myxococcota bacterium]
MSKQVCPHCHTEQHLKHHKAGQRVRCIQCHRSFCVVLEPRPFFEPGDPMLASAGPPGIPPMFPLPSMNAISMQLLRRIQRPKPQNPKRTPSANVLIEGYEIHECLGRGGMGQVFRAIQKSLGRQVAIKMLDLQLARNKASIMRFTKEAAAMAHLSHPNIVYVLDRGSVRNRYYFIMEYINGPSLRDLVQEGALALCDALEIMLSLAQTMDYAHCTGVIHRDLKPENILFSQLGHLKVADFGLAGMNQETTYIRKLTKSFVSMGTECYMAPEQQ